MALAFDEAQRSIDAAGLLQAFSRPAPNRWQRWFGHSHG